MSIFYGRIGSDLVDRYQFTSGSTKIQSYRLCVSNIPHLSENSGRFPAVCIRGASKDSLKSLLAQITDSSSGSILRSCPTRSKCSCQIWDIRTHRPFALAPHCSRQSNSGSSSVCCSVIALPIPAAGSVPQPAVALRADEVVLSFIIIFHC